MLDREKRLNEVYEHVHRYFNIHTKGEFADYIKYARAYISSAMNGNEKYLTDKLFDSICKAFPGVFDLDYLLTGEGSLLVLYGDEFLDMGVYSELPHYNCSKNGENSHNLLITALYDGTEIYIVEENGEQMLVDYLDAFQSLVVRVDIPESTEQYLGFWADGESFVYDISQEYIDVTNWTYLTR